MNLRARIERLELIRKRVGNTAEEEDRSEESKAIAALRLRMLNIENSDVTEIETISHKTEWERLGVSEKVYRFVEALKGNGTWSDYESSSAD